MSVIDKNRMNYSFQGNESNKLLPTDLSIIPFDNNKYASETTMTFTMSSGKYFVDPDKSYLDIDVGVAGGGVSALQVNFGTGSALNLFNGIRIYHRSGVQITHSLNTDLWSKAKQNITKDAFWFSSQGKVQGYVTSPTTDFLWTKTQTEFEVHKFKIKLVDLHPFFKGTDDKILPPQIADGLRIELDLNPKYRAFFGVAGSSAISDYEIQNPNIQTALVDVQPSASDLTNDIANKRGVEWTFNDVHMTTITIGTNENNFNVPVEKAVSSAQNILTFSRIRDSDNSLLEDSHKYTEPINTATAGAETSWNYRVGNVLYPFRRKVSSQVDSYTTLLDAFNWQYGTNLTFDKWKDNNAIYATNLLTEDRLLSSGEYLNANKKVELEFSKTVDSQFDRYVHSCLEYTKVLTANSTNSRLDD
jgi:hypothetical protein